MSLRFVVGKKGLGVVWGGSKRAPRRTASSVEAMRSVYHAADTSRLMSGWSTASISSDEKILRTRSQLVGRSRDQVEKNDYAKAFIASCRANVVGPNGFVLQSQVEDEAGADTVARAAIERAWSDWARAGNCDVTGSLSWLDLQSVFISTIARDGEFLARRVRTVDAGPHRYALQVLDPMLLDEQLNRDLANGHKIRLGVEVNPWGRPVAYWIRSPRYTDTTHAFEGRPYERYDASEILHVYLAEEPGQIRGLPWLSTALWRLRMLGAYEEAALVAARIGASKMGYFKTPTGEGYAGDDVDSDGAIIEDAAPGEFGQIAEGTELVSWDPTYPSNEFAPFNKAILRGISAGVNVSYHTLSKDLEGVNFSSIRAGLIEERDAWRFLQAWAVEHFARVVFEDWLPMALISGRITSPRGRPMPPDRLEKFRPAYFQTRGWDWVDPDKDGKAKVREIEQGIRSRTETIRERGRDPEEVWQEIAQEEARMDALGVPRAVVPGAENEEEPEAAADEGEPEDMEESA